MGTYLFKTEKKGRRNANGHSWHTLNVYKNTRTGMQKMGTVRHQTGGGSPRSSVNYYLQKKGINTNRKDVKVKEME